MNVDEAMELFGTGNKKFWTLQSGDHFNAGETLACEVERLRAELADTENARDSWRRVCEKETEAKHQAWAELAKYQQNEALQQLVDQAQKLDLGY
jgi:hypothetical protein